MTADLWTRLSDLVPHALGLPRDARDAFLDAACRAADGSPDTVLRHEAETLLRASDAADATERLRSPLTGITSDVAGDEQIPARALPSRIGAWEVRGVLGEGGMGVVYRARRADGVFDREVALKRLRAGQDPDLARRLDAERRTLARLEHDGIARLYDGGVDADGAPFLVMECIDGEPITAYADHAGLGVPARVALFVRVCEAVAYAHRHLVVHRDLKPSNVFVTPEGAPKLLDFGVAKLLDEVEDGAETRFTLPGAMTPAYAAPEQVRGETVTTATDVYALGVLLYELLAGTRPYDLSGQTASDIERTVCETTPPLPSSAPRAGSQTSAQARELRGDLDTVVMKAMEKEPARRYATAEALADDLRRHLTGQPVAARPASRAYRARLFVRRHRAGVAGASAVILALVGGIVATSWQARVARDEAAKAEAVQDFMIGMLGAADPDQDGRDVRVADLLDRAAADLDATFQDQPAVRADAHLRLGRTYYDLGLLPEAEAQLRRALRLRERLGDPLGTAEAQTFLGNVLRDLAQYPSADSLYALALATRQQENGPSDPQTAIVWAEIGTLRYVTGDAEASVAAHRRALAIEEAALAPDDPELILSIGNLAVALSSAGETDEAAALLERQVRLYRTVLPDDRVGRANALANLGSLYAGADRFGDAERAQTEAVALFRSALGDAHPSTAFGLSNLGSTTTLRGRPREAEALLRESVQIYRTASGMAHPNVGFPLVNLAKALRDQGRLDEAEAAAREAARLFRDGFGDDHWTEERIGETLATIAAKR